MTTIPNPTARGLCFTLAVLTFLGLAAPSTAEDYSRRILWRNKEHTEATFIPATVLNEMKPEALPMSQGDRDSFLATLVRARNPPLPRSAERSKKPLGCEGRLTPKYRPGGSPTARALADVLAEAPLLVVGRVLEEVPGWFTSNLTPSTVVYFEVEEVLKDTYRRTQVGDTLGWLRYGADFQVVDVQLCHVTDGQDPDTSAGRRLLFLLGQSDIDPLDGSGLALAVVNDVVERGRYGDIQQAGPLPLSSLRKTLREGGLHD